MDNRPIRKRLLEKGYLVTEKEGKSLGIKMITDLKGNEIGFLTPLECVEKLLK